MLIAQENTSIKESAKTVQQVLTACTFNKIEVQSSPVFDVEYLFLKIRAKSVGSKIELNITCPDDKKTKVSHTVDLDDISVQVDEEHTNEINITDNIKIIMSYPSLNYTRDIDVASTEDMFKI